MVTLLSWIVCLTFFSLNSRDHAIRISISS
nr:MAG TPA: hypothetical protein [Caudoviricetes sp.]